MLPLSEKFSARIPVFTGFPSDTKVLAKRDSSLLKNIKDMAIHIQQDPFLMGLIDQVDITSQRSFELLPKIGNQLIVFGDASSYDKKFDKLKLFYKNIIVKSGFGRYNLINLQYDNQVVAGIRGKEDVIADSLRTKMLMQLIAEETERMASDSARAFLPDQEKNTDSTIVLQSIQRDETAEEQDAFVPLSSASTNTVTTATVIKAPTVKPSAVISTRVLKPKAAAKTEVAKPKKPVKPIVKSTEKKAVLKPTPKAVMQPKNEY
jgi:cell division protein FtsQ